MGVYGRANFSVGERVEAAVAIAADNRYSGRGRFEEDDAKSSPSLGIAKTSDIP